MGLMSDLKKAIESDEKNFGKENVPFMHKSDFQIFDYLNGQLDYSKSGKPIFNVGIDAGKSIMVVGKPGSGKSTFAYQYAYSIMKRYDESSLYIMDFENAFKESRFKSITGCDINSVFLCLFIGFKRVFLSCVRVYRFFYKTMESHCRCIGICHE